MTRVAVPIGDGRELAGMVVGDGPTAVVILWTRWAQSPAATCSHTLRIPLDSLETVARGLRKLRREAA